MDVYGMELRLVKIAVCPWENDLTSLNLSYPFLNDITVF